MAVIVLVNCKDWIVFFLPLLLRGIARAVPAADDVLIAGGVAIVVLDSGSDRLPGVTARQYALGFALDV